MFGLRRGCGLASHDSVPGSGLRIEGLRSKVSGKRISASCLVLIAKVGKGFCVYWLGFRVLG